MIQLSAGTRIWTAGVTDLRRPDRQPCGCLDGYVLRAAAQGYGVDAEAVTLKVKQEFAAKGEGEENHKDGIEASGEAQTSRLVQG